jgi:hypothetical protein
MSAAEALSTEIFVPSASSIDAPETPRPRTSSTIFCMSGRAVAALSRAGPATFTSTSAAPRKLRSLVVVCSTSWSVSRSAVSARTVSIDVRDGRVRLRSGPEVSATLGPSDRIEGSEGHPSRSVRAAATMEILRSLVPLEPPLLVSRLRRGLTGVKTRKRCRGADRVNVGKPPAAASVRSVRTPRTAPIQANATWRYH